jgi:hypothetical protein
MRRREAGFAFLLVLLLATLLLLSLSVAVPRVLTEGQREKEEEMIFRGNQYRRAIGLYFRRFGRYPLKLDDLLRSNDRSYLRRAYTNPTSLDGKWRFIRVGPNGEYLGSVNRPKGPGIAGGDERGGGRTRGQTGEGTAGDSPYPIIGVGGTSEAPSIRRFEEHDRYIEWEFIFEPLPGGRGRGSGGGTTPPR